MQQLSAQTLALQGSPLRKISNLILSTSFDTVSMPRSCALNGKKKFVYIYLRSEIARQSCVEGCFCLRESNFENSPKFEGDR